MQVNELVLEITRRCNVQCLHCLRGPAQKVDISNETIDKTLVGITQINNITFTGGEPSLAVAQIKYFTKRVKELGIQVNSFYVITNGKIASRALVDALIDLYQYCDPWDTEEFWGGLTISQDQYHKEQGYDMRPAKRLYNALKFFHPEERKEDILKPISEGWAEINGIGCRSIRPTMNVIGLDENDNVAQVDEVVYINVLGDVVPSCDMSYQSQAEHKIGNVHENTLAEIMKQLVGPAIPEESLLEVA
jgi:sulfatase maturation enzyme AslB (radical SAM superfamily)